MFERFTDRARSVIVLAQEEARLLNHNYIGTEHLLLGLLRESEGVAAMALARLGIALDDVRTNVEKIIGRGGTAPSGHVPFTPRAKKVIELSLREALQLGHNYIGTEHLLLGLIREGEGVAAQVLARMGADLSQVRREVIEVLSGYARPPAVQSYPTGEGETPAAARATVEARRLAGSRPVATADVLRAIAGETDSLGAKALEALGVSPAALEAQLAKLARAGTSDELPEEAGARHTTVEIIGDRIAVVIEDDILRERLAEALMREPPVVRSDEPAAAAFPSLWREVYRHLTGVVMLLEREEADRWRPPEFAEDWGVAAYAVIQRPGGAVCHLELAEGADRDEIRAAVGEWLTAHQPRNQYAVNYLAILVDADDDAGRSYRISWGTSADPPRTQLNFLVAHAIVDLLRQTEPPSS